MNEIHEVEEHDGTVADRVQEELDARKEKKGSRSKADMPKLPRYLLIVARKRSANKLTNRTGLCILYRH